VNLGYDRPLYMLAFDHRASFSRDLFGIAGVPTFDEAVRGVRERDGAAGRLNLTRAGASG
jgi:hypothetical protein